MVAWKTSKMLNSSVQPTGMQLNTKRSRSVGNSFIPLVAVFGVTWIIGVFVAIQDTPAFDLIFVVVNGLQGFVIFLSQLLCSKQVRNAWNEHKDRVSTRTF
ncbi:adhesion G-protein coupled receptor D1-like isoform X2 [Anneissia japonica]|nr:adhesion G-protein coupled receptor D1-like isoform X2 [Anneissia japonica]